MCTWDFAIKSFMRLDFHLVGDRDMGDVDDDGFFSRAQHIPQPTEIMKICNFFNKINKCDGVSEDELQPIEFVFMKKKLLFEEVISICYKCNASSGFLEHFCVTHVDSMHEY